MIKFSEFRPTSYDTHLTVKDRENWLVLPCTTNRDADCLTESNFETAKKQFHDCPAMCGIEGEWEVLEFGHWACGWFSIIVVKPGTTAHKVAEKIERDLENYPVLDENDYSDREYTAACETWEHCYTDRERLAYMKDHQSLFSYNEWSDMMKCMRGLIFCGVAGELLG